MKPPKFIIVSPRSCDGGPVALKALCMNLNKLGYDASLYFTKFMKVDKDNYNAFLLPFRKLRSQIKDIRIYRLVKKKGKDYFRSIKRYRDYTETNYDGIKITRFPIAGAKTIVVYPEIVYGNLLHARRSVRYFLYHNRYINDPKAYGKEDLFICYRKIFNDWELNPKGYETTISYFDLDIYKRVNYGKRQGKCYILRKGSKRSDLPLEFDGIVVDKLIESEKVRVFNESEYCISYDTQTAYSEIAALCGCISIVVPEEGKTRADYRTNNEKVYGVAFGFSDEEIQYAKETMHLVKDKFLEINEEGKKNTEQFARICIDYFNGREHSNSGKVL